MCLQLGSSQLIATEIHIPNRSPANTVFKDFFLKEVLCWHIWLSLCSYGWTTPDHLSIWIHSLSEIFTILLAIVILRCSDFSNISVPYFFFKSIFIHTSTCVFFFYHHHFFLDLIFHFIQFVFPPAFENNRLLLFRWLRQQSFRSQPSLPLNPS